MTRKIPNNIYSVNSPLQSLNQQQFHQLTLYENFQSTSILSSHRSVWRGALRTTPQTQSLSNSISSARCPSVVRRKGTDWIPAFAGMTELTWSSVSTSVRSRLGHCRDRSVSKSTISCWRARSILAELPSLPARPSPRPSRPYLNPDSAFISTLNTPAWSQMLQAGFSSRPSVPLRRKAVTG